MYRIEDPLKCLERPPPPKETYKKDILTKITAFHERELRQIALSKTETSMKYLNVSLIGLGGRLHPAITGVSTTHEVRKMRPHIKMLSGNYLTFEMKARQSGGSNHCRLCSNNIELGANGPYIESLEHLIAQCIKFEDLRNRITTTITNLCQQAKISIDPRELSSHDFTQLILDPSSMSLSPRVKITDPVLPQFFRISRDFCYSIDKLRIATLALLV